jgi:hypothetical protein
MKLSINGQDLYVADQGGITAIHVGPGNTGWSGTIWRGLPSLAAGALEAILTFCRESRQQPYRAGEIRYDGLGKPYVVPLEGLSDKERMALKDKLRW